MDNDNYIDYLCSVTHSILINGVPFEFFLPSKSIRQEDPISPYLSRVIEAKYYPLGDFQTTQLGHQPSYIWMNILVARPYLLQGVI